MPQYVTVKPAPGIVFRVPTKNFAQLPVDGERVALDPYWQRAIDNKEVILVPNDPPPALPATAPSDPKSTGG